MTNLFINIKQLKEDFERNYGIEIENYNFVKDTDGNIYTLELTLAEAHISVVQSTMFETHLKALYPDTLDNVFTRQLPTLLPTITLNFNVDIEEA
jgi:hypothetical protein